MPQRVAVTVFVEVPGTHEPAEAAYIAETGVRQLLFTHPQFDTLTGEHRITCPARAPESIAIAEVAELNRAAERGALRLAPAAEPYRHLLTAPASS